MNNILISVIVPIYNVEDYIEECIQSLINQTFQRFEVLFVDDCGTDGSIKVINDYISSHKIANAKIIRRDKNGGLSAARNSGIEKALGDYLYFLDSDDYIDDSAIEAFANVIQSGTYDVVIADYIKFPKQEICSNNLDKEILRGFDIQESYYNNKIVVTAWNKLINREFLVKNNLYFENGIIHEDIIWSFLVMSKAKSLFYISKPTYLYRVRENSIMTNSFGEKNINSLERILGVMSMQDDIMSSAIAREFFYKKCLEFSLRVYALKGKVFFIKFIKEISPFTKRIQSHSDASWVFRLIIHTPNVFSSLLINLLLKTKFGYLR